MAGRIRIMIGARALAAAVLSMCGHAAMAQPTADGTPGISEEGVTEVRACWQRAVSGRAFRAECAEAAMRVANALSLERKEGESSQALALGLLEEALTHVTRNDDPLPWAALHGDLSQVHARFQSRQEEHFRAARNALALATEVFQALYDGTRGPCEDHGCEDRAEQARQWLSMIWQNVARIELEDPTGDLPANLARAREAIEAALELGDERPAREVVNMRTVLGRILLSSPVGSRAENVEQAVQHLEQAVEEAAGACTCYSTRLDLARAYVERLGGDPVYNRALALRVANEVRSAAYTSGATDVDSVAEPPAAVEQARALIGLDDASAIAHAAVAVDFFGRYESHRQSLIEARRVLAAAYLERGRREGDESALTAAAKQLEAALGDARALGAPRTIGQVEQQLGEALVEREVYAGGSSIDSIDRALQVLDRAAPLVRRDGAPERMARLELDRGRGMLEKWRRLPGSDVTLAREGVEALERAYAIVEDQPLVSLKTAIQVELGNLFFDQRRWDQANEHYEIALGRVASWLAPELSFTQAGIRFRLALVRNAFARSAYCLLRDGRPTEALIRSQQGQALELSMELGGVLYADLDDGGEARATLAEVRRLEAAWGRTHLGSPESVAVGAELRVARRGLYALFDQIVQRVGPPATIEQSLYEISRPGGATVVVLVTSSGSALFVLPHGATAVDVKHVVSLPDFTDATAIDLSLREGGWLPAFKEYRDHSTSVEARARWMADVERIGERVWHALGRPIRDALRAAAVPESAPVTIVVPNGLPAWLFLHAATRPVDGAHHGLSDDFEVSYAPSTFAALVARQRVDSRLDGRNMLALLNPTGDFAYEALEADGLRATFSDRALEILARDQATTDAVEQRAGRFSYLHFSAHGVFDLSNTANTGIVLASSEPGEGRRLFSAPEISARLEMADARLATLSACESGLAEFSLFHQESEGLPAAFLRAGVPAVISSSWKVSELPSVLLMLKLYGGLVHERLRPAGALKAAQQWLRGATLGEIRQFAREAGFDGDLKTSCPNRTSTCRPFANPFYWAAFTMTGY